MDKYLVYDIHTFDGGSLGVVTGSTIEEALENAKFLYGENVTVIRQYETSAVGFDPWWALLAVLLAAMYFRKKK